VKHGSRLLLIAWLAACAAHAREPVTASVSATRAAAGEIFYITLHANGSDVKEPDLGPVAAAGVQLGSPSVQSSTSMQYINGKSSVIQSRAWRYPASVAQEGTITIPRISITVDGREYFTQPMTIEISRVADTPVPVPGKGGKLSVEEMAFVRAVTDKSSVYQGEPLTLRLQIYQLNTGYISITGPRSLPMPDTEGFYPGPEWQDTHMENYKDQEYEVTEFGRVLYPAMPGELKIGAWNWQGMVRWHDTRRRVQSAARMFTAPEIAITVMSLPEQPEGFSGAVGKFRFTAQLAQTALTQGTPVRLTFTVSGEGNPNTISAPRLPDLAWAHVSGPETETRQEEHSPEVAKTFSYLLTPLEAGTHTIPSVPFVFFAPIIKNYKTEQSPEYQVTVDAADGGNTLVAVGGSADAQRSRIQVFEEKILPVITEGDALFSESGANSARLSILALLSPALPLLVFIVLFAWLAWRGRLSRDQGYARRFYAKNKCLKALKEARASAEPSENLDVLLKVFIADMLNVNEAGLTSSDVEDLLKERRIAEDSIAMTVRVLRACERARYAGRNAGPEETEALCTATENVVEQLHAALQETQS